MFMYYVPINSVYDLYTVLYKLIAAIGIINQKQYYLVQRHLLIYLSGQFMSHPYKLIFNYYLIARHPLLKNYHEDT